MTSWSYAFSLMRIFWVAIVVLRLSSRRALSGARRVLVAPDPLDDLLAKGARHFLVRMELHGVGGPALGAAPEIGRVSEHLGQGHEGTDDTGSPSIIQLLDATTAAVDVADDVAHEVFGGPDLALHHGFEQHR